MDYPTSVFGPIWYSNYWLLIWIYFMFWSHISSITSDELYFDFKSKDCLINRIQLSKSTDI